MSAKTPPFTPDNREPGEQLRPDLPETPAAPVLLPPDDVAPPAAGDAAKPVPVQGRSLPEEHPDFRAGTAALAAMPDEEFEVRLVAMRRGRERITRIHRELMDPETDYGVIPGTKQPTLLKPGAEKLCDFYRLAAAFRPEITYGDGQSAPPITVVTECRLHLGTLDGPVVNTGYGAANSWEKRYRYRRGERSCPACGKTGAIVKGRPEYGGGWLCFAKKGGCGAKYAEDAPEIVDQPVGDIENPDPYDLLNTLLKIAEKRSYVDAVLRATATSGLYTQDVEEGEADGTEASRARGPAETAAPVAAEATGRGRSTGPSATGESSAAEPTLSRSVTAPAGSEPQPGGPARGNVVDLSLTLNAERPTLKEAYQAFLNALEAAGFQRGDAAAARRAMETGAGRRSTKAAPYTIEEFLQVAEQLRRRRAA